MINYPWLHRSVKCKRTLDIKMPQELDTQQKGDTLVLNQKKLVCS